MGRKLLMGLFNPELLELEVSSDKIVLPFVWEKKTDSKKKGIEQNGSWREQQAQFKLKIKKKITGAASVPDNLLNFLTNNFLPKAIKTAVIGALIQELSIVFPPSDDISRVHVQGYT